MKGRLLCFRRWCVEHANRLLLKRCLLVRDLVFSFPAVLIRRLEGSVLRMAGMKTAEGELSRRPDLPPLSPDTHPQH